MILCNKYFSEKKDTLFPHYDAGFIILMVGINQETDNELWCKHQIRYSDPWGVDSRSASHDIFMFTEPAKVYSQTSCSETHDNSHKNPIPSNIIIPFTLMPSSVYSWTFCMQLWSLSCVLLVQTIIPSWLAVIFWNLFYGKTLGKPH
jgi:hypothetical protein